MIKHNKIFKSSKSYPGIRIIVPSPNRHIRCLFTGLGYETCYCNFLLRKFVLVPSYPLIKTKSLVKSHKCQKSKWNGTSNFEVFSNYWNYLNFNVSIVSSCSTAHVTAPESPMSVLWGPLRDRFQVYPPSLDTKRSGSSVESASPTLPCPKISPGA